jgi:hypothetical protein
MLCNPVTTRERPAVGFTQWAVTLVITAVAAQCAIAGDWVAARSTYSHHPQTGQRVAQYAPVGPVYAAPDPYVAQNGYRHIQNIITSPSAGRATDYLHVVEQWGPIPVRPYGEWEFPYRPYSVPYWLWGPPPPVVVVTPWGVYPPLTPPSSP